MGWGHAPLGTPFPNTAGEMKKVRGGSKTFERRVVRLGFWWSSRPFWPYA
jgi:hypothetical protein